MAWDFENAKTTLQTYYQELTDYKSYMLKDEYQEDTIQNKKNQLEKLEQHVSTLQSQFCRLVNIF